MQKLKLFMLLIAVSLVGLSCIPNKNNTVVTPPVFTPAPDDEKREGPDPYKEPDESEWIHEARELTDNFSNFPSSNDVNEYLDNATNPPTEPCDASVAAGGAGDPVVEPPEEKILPPAARGARKLLASFFQSCKAIDIPIDNDTPNLRGVTSARTIDGQSGAAGGRIRKITNRRAYVNSHIVLKELKKDANYPEGPMCKDATKNPPVYGYGSRAIPNRDGSVRIIKKGGGVARTSAAAAGIDCSAFMNVALASQGLKITKTSGPFTGNTTRSFHAHVNSSNSCLKNAQISPEDNIRPGDMLNMAGSHVVMIDSVGDDPLGIKKYSASGNCNGINPAEFDFTYIHSGAIKNSYGPSRVKANIHRSGTMWNNLRVMAVKMCQQKVANDNGSVNSGKMAGISTRFNLIRHQSEEPECVSDKKVKIEGEDCINQCENINRDVSSER